MQTQLASLTNSVWGKLIGGLLLCASLVTINAAFTKSYVRAATTITAVIPVGTVDGVNHIFTLPDKRRAFIYMNGVMLKRGVGYKRSGTTLIYLGFAPDSKDVMWAEVVGKP